MRSIAGTKPCLPVYPFIWQHPQTQTTWMRSNSVLYGLRLDVCLAPGVGIFSLGDVTEAKTEASTAWNWRISNSITLEND